MLVQSCPAPPSGGLGGLSQGGLGGLAQGGLGGLTQGGLGGLTQGGLVGLTQGGLGGLSQGGLVFPSSPYCGLTTASSSSSDYSSSSLQDMSALPIAHQDAVNGNQEEEDEGRGSDTDNRITFLTVESDEIVTESQVLNIETTITETFTINTNDIHRDFDGGRVRRSEEEEEEEERRREELERRSVSFSDSDDEVLGSTMAGAPNSLDIYSDRFERAFGFGEQGMVISPASPASSISSVRSRGRGEEEQRTVEEKQSVGEEKQRVGEADSQGEVQKKSW